MLPVQQSGKLHFTDVVVTVTILQDHLQLLHQILLFHGAAALLRQLHGM